MGNNHCRRRVPGRGSVQAGRGDTRGGPRIVVQFDEDTFGDLRSRAERRGVSVAQVIREAVEFGLMDMADGEAA